MIYSFVIERLVSGMKWQGIAIRMRTNDLRKEQMKERRFTHRLLADVTDRQTAGVNRPSYLFDF